MIEEIKKILINNLKASGNFSSNEENKILQCYNLQELGFNSFDEIIAFMHDNGLPLVLSEEDKKIETIQKAPKSLQDLACVHKTNFAPKDGIIKTAKDEAVSKICAFI